jgi:hypothetical protein
LESLLPPVVLEAKEPTTTLDKKILTAMLNEPENLKLMKQKDSLYQKKLSEAKEVVKVRLSRPGRVRRNEEDEAFLFSQKGRPGWECVQCFAQFMEKTVLCEDLNWVVCPKCDSPQHYSCIKLCKMCICGLVIRLHRVAKDN